MVYLESFLLDKLTNYSKSSKRPISCVICSNATNKRQMKYKLMIQVDKPVIHTYGRGVVDAPDPELAVRGARDQLGLVLNNHKVPHLGGRGKQRFSLTILKDSDATLD